MLVISYEDRDKKQVCSKCQSESLVRYYGKMPGITRASYIDSGKTARAAQMDPIKKAAELEVIKANTPRKERGEIQKEINNLTKIKP